MAKMTDRMKELFQKVPTVVLATATGDGIPNAVPVGAKKIIDDETILISDQFFNKTLGNMKTNPNVSVPSGKVMKDIS
jgi:predicted pyridoxine 5'-phosphate oxidase superfamily flavin-nucleotide-binding protein